jgi:hypothetical protein
VTRMLRRRSGISSGLASWFCCVAMEWAESRGRCPARSSTLPTQKS